jgi:hypothetical protein
MSKKQISRAEWFTMEAIALIQSPSMQAWAKSPTNLPIIIKMAEANLAKQPELEPLRFATYLTLVAMG